MCKLQIVLNTPLYLNRQFILQQDRHTIDKTNLGKISEPCCINAPKENHKVLDNVKAFVTEISFRDASARHSNGLQRPIKNSTRLTPVKARLTQTQTMESKGSIKENTPGFCLSGFFIIMLMPIFMKGLVKSTTLCLARVIVKEAKAKSAFCKDEVNKLIYNSGKRCII